MESENNVGDCTDHLLISSDGFKVWERLQTNVGRHHNADIW